MLVPVLPFLVREMGYSRFAYGVLQSSMWMSQTILSPLLGALSDSIGRRTVIFVSLLISASGCLLLGLSSSFPLMLLARIITGSGFQIALFRAYFADTTVKEKVRPCDCTRLVSSPAPDSFRAFTSQTPQPWKTLLSWVGLPRVLSPGPATRLLSSLLRSHPLETDSRGRTVAEGNASDGVRYVGARSGVAIGVRSVTKLRLDRSWRVFLSLQERSETRTRNGFTPKAST